ncbi:hypothetical protein NB703_003875 [Pantoea ananatis]|uniref:Uncharacterized protein n=1 Tax=Pantoea ananas TaxID=553 RepID=A0AAJ1D2A4_PANAN|nr:hypothetical protein [Pantoea ananatis]MCW0345782.1 hypothetical protein [Pantoea ananatis]
MVETVYRMTRESLPHRLSPFQVFTIMDSEQKRGYSGSG